MNRTPSGPNRRLARAVTGVARPPRCRYRGYLWVLVASLLTRERVVCAALLLPVGAAGLASATARPAAHPRPVQHAALVIERPLPNGLAHRDVPKWVPLRQPSGRTELEPWTSVDAARVRHPEVRAALLSHNPLPDPSADGRRGLDSAATPNQPPVRDSRAEAPSAPSPTVTPGTPVH